MKKIVKWFKKDWQKIDKTKSLIMLCFVTTVMVGLILSAIIWKNQPWYNAFSTMGAIGLASLLISLAIRLSMFESFLIATKNMSIKRHNKHYQKLKNEQKPLYTRQTYQEENKAKAWVPFILYAIVFALMITVGLIVYALM